MISIHTLAWRVTLDIYHAIADMANFNPHPRVEGDKDYIEKAIADRKFQSTPSRGG